MLEPKILFYVIFTLFKTQNKAFVEMQTIMAEFKIKLWLEWSHSFVSQTFYKTHATVQDLLARKMRVEDCSQLPPHWIAIQY